MPWKTVNSVADLNPAGVEAPSSFGRGLSDPISGLAQLAEKVLPEGISSGINRIDNFLAEQTGGLLGNPEETFSQGLQAQEQDFQQQRAAAGESGFDAARLGGNLAATLPMALAGPAAAATLPGRIGQGAALGGAFSATQPVSDDANFVEEKAKQVGAGMIGGGVAAPALGAAARVVQPKVSEGIRKLMGEGITPSPGQIMGGAFKATEEKLRSLPITGDLITSANKAAGRELNTAAYNRALAPIGQSADDIPVGPSGVNLVKTKLSDAYNKLLPKLKFQSDPEFRGAVAELQHRVNRELEPKFRRLFDNALEDKVTSKLNINGRMTGKTLKAVEEDLGKLVKRQQGGNAAERAYGEVLDDLRSTIRDVTVRSSPEQAAELQAINEGYANYVIIRDAAKRAGTEDGFSPAQLMAAVRNQDKSAGKGAAAGGKALMQDLAGPGTEFLTSRYPDSGSIGRAAIGLATGFVNPAIPAGLLGGAAAFTRPAQKAIAGVMTQRPEGAAKLADAIRQTSPLGGLLAQQALDKQQSQ